jgi:hypothetical protein
VFSHDLNKRIRQEDGATRVEVARLKLPKVESAGIAGPLIGRASGLPHSTFNVRIVFLESFRDIPLDLGALTLQSKPILLHLSLYYTDLISTSSHLSHPLSEPSTTHSTSTSTHFSRILFSAKSLACSLTFKSKRNSLYLSLHYTELTSAFSHLFSPGLRSLDSSTSSSISPRFNFNLHPLYSQAPETSPQPEA